MKRHSGFTLVELMVTVAIFSVVIAAIGSALIAVAASSERVRRLGDTQEAARLTLAALEDDLRLAGMGASNGDVAVAACGGGSCKTRRIPMIYSGADQTITEPGGGTITSNSIFIVSADPLTIGSSADNTAVQASTVAGGGLRVTCNGGANGAAVDCKTIFPIGSRLLVGDLQDAMMVTVTGDYAGTVGGQGGQVVTYGESSASNFYPSPTATAIASGLNVSRVRVVHWWVKQVPGRLPMLVRSRPVLAGTLPAACSETDVPFVDESNAAAGTTNPPVGAEVGSGPVEALQIRFAVTPMAGVNDPSQYTLLATLPQCNLLTAQLLREVRLQVVSIAAQPDQSSGGSVSRGVTYSTPGFEDLAAGTTQDPYPRRAYTARVTPRNLPGGLLQ